MKPDSRRENWRANWNSTQPLATMGGCRLERIRAESKWDLSAERLKGYLLGKERLDAIISITS